jgi:hypothetical protein
MDTVMEFIQCVYLDVLYLCILDIPFVCVFYDFFFFMLISDFIGRVGFDGKSHSLELNFHFHMGAVLYLQGPQYNISQ